MCISYDIGGGGDDDDAQPPMISKGTKENVIIVYLAQWIKGQYEMEDNMQWKWVWILLLKHM